MNQDQINQLMYLVSFLGILVDRAGGELVIENLSEFSGNDVQLGMFLDKENDRVKLVIEKKKSSRVLHG